MHTNKVLSQRIQSKPVSIRYKVADGIAETVVGASRKTVDTMQCLNCNHVYERAGLEGFFSEMFEGCPKCGHGKTEEYDN